MTKLAWAAAMVVLVQVSGPSERPPMKVTYDPDATQPYDPGEPAGSLGGLCAQVRGAPDEGAEVADDVSRPQLLRMERGDYSDLTAETRPVGVFVAEFMIGTEGLVTDVLVLHSLSPEFDRVALGELESRVYQPATRNGVAVPVCGSFSASSHR